MRKRLAFAATSILITGLGATAVAQSGALSSPVPLPSQPLPKTGEAAAPSPGEDAVPKQRDRRFDELGDLLGTETPCAGDLWGQRRAERLPADVNATKPVSCITYLKRMPGKGVWLVERTTTTAGGLGAFTTALRAPDSEPSGPVGCLAVYIAVPPFALEDATGKLWTPRLPKTACPPYMPAFDALTQALAGGKFTEREARRVATEAEVQRFCTKDPAKIVDEKAMLIEKKLIEKKLAEEPRTDPPVEGKPVAPGAPAQSLGGEPVIVDDGSNVSSGGTSDAPSQGYPYRQPICG